MKNDLMGSLVDWTQWRKESVSLKLPKLKCKEKKECEHKTEYLRTMEQLQKM